MGWQHVLLVVLAVELGGVAASVNCGVWVLIFMRAETMTRGNNEILSLSMETRKLCARTAQGPFQEERKKKNQRMLEHQEKEDMHQKPRIPPTEPIGPSPPFQTPL